MWEPALNKKDFNPRTSCEVRLKIIKSLHDKVTFQSTHLLRGATGNPSSCMRFSIFQSTHLLRGATVGLGVMQTRDSISIHAPLARCDCRYCGYIISILNFNPRTSCEVRPTSSTCNGCATYFNPRTSCEVRPATGRSYPKGIKISIHAPLARCDSRLRWHASAISYFNPRTSCEVRPSDRKAGCY